MNLKNFKNDFFIFFLLLFKVEFNSLLVVIDEVLRLHQCQLSQTRHASVCDSGSRLCLFDVSSMRHVFTPLLRRFKDKENWCAGSCDMKLAQPYNKKGDGPTPAEEKAKKLAQESKDNEAATNTFPNPDKRITDLDEKEQKVYEEPIGAFPVDLLNKIKNVLGVVGVDKLIECNYAQCENHECSHCNQRMLILMTDNGLNQAI